MKNLKLHWLIPLSATAAAVLRWGFLAVGLDEKGLLVRNHPLELTFWAVLAVWLALVLGYVRKQERSSRYEDSFGPSAPGALGHVLLAAAVLAMMLGGEAPSGRIGLLRTVLGWAAVPALVWAGICRRKGKTPFFLTYAAVCLFFLLQLVSRYQSWSGNPQMMLYVPELLALVALEVFSYQLAAFAADKGSRRSCLALGLLAPVLCAGAMVGTENALLYLAGGIWAVTNLCKGKGEAPHEAA